MDKDKIEQLADDYAASYIQTHTNIPMDDEKYRALVRAFISFYRETQGLPSSDPPKCTCWVGENLPSGFHGDSCAIGEWARVR